MNSGVIVRASTSACLRIGMCGDGRCLVATGGVLGGWVDGGEVRAGCHYEHSGGEQPPSIVLATVW